MDAEVHKKSALIALREQGPPPAVNQLSPKWVFVIAAELLKGWHLWLLASYMFSSSVSAKITDIVTGNACSAWIIWNYEYGILIICCEFCFNCGQIYMYFLCGRIWPEFWSKFCWTLSKICPWVICTEFFTNCV